MTDEALCARAAEGDRAAEETLVLRYTRQVRVSIRPFFLAGGDQEDLMQEGMLGLLSAIRAFDAVRGVRFHTFALHCVRRRVISAVREASGDKHSPLNHCVTLEPSLFSANQDIAPLSPAYQRQDDPEEVIIGKESLTVLENAIQSQLTTLEAQVLARYLDGASYLEIAKEVQRSTKAVDNAVQRIRRKVARHLSQGEYSKS